MCAITVNISSTIIRIVLQTTFEMESTENKLTQTNMKTNDQTDERGKKTRQMSRYSEQGTHG